MMNIYVGNLPYKSNDQDLVDLFSQFGEVARTSIIMDRESGRSRGFGFVEMPDRNAGQAAIEALNGKEYGGRYLTVNEARPRAPRPAGTGGGGGARGGYGGHDAQSSDRY